MKHFPTLCLSYAHRIMPDHKKGWAEAMAVELSYIEADRARVSFALGCLRTAVGVSARTRKGLSFIGRGLVASALLLVTVYMTILALMWPSPQVAQLILLLCGFYAVAGVLCAVSVPAMRLYVALLALAGSGAWVVIKIKHIETLDLPHAFLSAVMIEAVGVMCALFIAASYLQLLQDPESEL